MSDVIREKQAPVAYVILRGAARQAPRELAYMVGAAGWSLPNGADVPARKLLWCLYYVTKTADEQG